MRKLMWFTIGFAAACGLYCSGLGQDWLIPLALGGLSFSVAGLVAKLWRPAAFCCLGLSLGIGWCCGFSQMYLADAKVLDGTSITASVTVTEYSWESGFGAAVDGKMQWQGNTYQVRVYLDDAVDLAPGDGITGVFRMRYTPGGQESATYHPGKGIFLLAYQQGEAVIEENEDPGFSPARLARNIKDRLRSLFPEDTAGFVQALLLGDSSGLDYETETAFRISGIRHIIAVSGLHVTILYSLLSAVTFRKRYLTALVAFPVLFLFAAVAGFTPSVTRACVMVCLMILAQLVNKGYDSPTALAFAVLVMLAVNPMVITAIGFQLSVGCVAGIQLFENRIRQWLTAAVGEIKGKGLIPRLKRGTVSSLSVSVSAMSLVTPFSAYYFGTVSLVGIVTNLVTLWIVNLIFNGLIAVCLVSFVSMNLAGGLAWLLAWPIRLVLWISRVLAAFPLASVYTASPYIVAWLVFVYVLLGAYLLSDRKKPHVGICCAVMGLCMALLVSWLEPLGDDLRVTVLDVGQGQSILLQAEGKTFLVDCGGDSEEDAADIAAETLLSQGIRHLDGVIITHCDADHVGGLENLLTRVTADVIFYPATEELSLEDQYLCPVSDRVTLTAGEARLEIFGPIYTLDANENSLCVLFTVGDCDILITGDRSSLGEMALLSQYSLPDVELLIAGHHGSKYSTSQALLDAVRPEYIFVSASADNAYGHPAQEMLDRAAGIGATVYRTDLQGTLIFRR